MNYSIITTDMRSEHDLMLTRQRARQLAGLLGFEMQDQTRIATAVSEIARNAVQHAGGGRAEFKLVGGSPQVFQIVVQDHGSGIEDAESMLQPQSLADGQRGQSLRGVRELMDVFQVETGLSKGTRVILGKRCYRSHPAFGPQDMARISDQLLQMVSSDPLAEMQRQNQELLHTLEELRLEQKERAGHQKEIETLNLKLRRSVRATHHRVKNNLQIISALVEIQSDTMDNMVPLSAMQRVGRHARALAALHDILTKETQEPRGMEVISTKVALSELLLLLQDTAGGRQITSEVDDFPLSVGDCASLALLISELVSNALKHGSSDVYLQLSVIEGMARLEVHNDGCGFPPDFDWRTAANTGLTLIDSTGRHDLRGKVSFENRLEGGARVVVTFPVSLNREEAYE
jgi:two-component sensor histidine kinase